MSKTKKGKKLTKNLGDITLNDFANSAVIKSRPKKSTSNVAHVIKKLEEDKSWDEKLDEFEGEFVETQDEEGKTTFVLQKSDVKKRKPRNTLKHDQENRQESGNEYPLDIWFLISEYIRPEDVGRFAGICRTSFAVTNTAKFWFNLYKRCYKSVPNLPERLQPECMLRLYGIRTSVIRSLYYMYLPFTEKLRSTITFEKHPDCLNRHQCISMWYHKQSYWYYCFKLKENNIYSLPRNSTLKKPDLIEMLEDVSANSEENCRILEITCKFFTAVPIIQGLTLNSVIMTLSPTFRHHKLQMVFGSGAIYVTQRPIGSSTSTVILDNVINVKILDWWHPSYPHNNNIMELLSRND